MTPSRNLIQVWIEKAEADAFDQDMASAALLSEYEPRIAALKRLFERQALKIEIFTGLRKTHGDLDSFLRNNGLSSLAKRSR